MRSIIAALLLAGTALAVAVPAQAFCRKTTAGGDGSFDPSLTGACAADSGSKALPLFWDAPCLELRVTVDPALEAQGKMTQARAAAIVGRAKAAWLSAQCTTARGAEAPALRIVDVAEARCPQATGAPDNEIKFTAEPAAGDGLLASTDVTFDSGTGRISRAQTSLLDVYAEIGGTDANVEYVVRHELGHFLGLAHSEKSDAVMSASYDARQKVDGLTDDDVSAVCDVYGPDKPIGAGCGVGRGGEGSGWLFAAIAAACALRRRRRRPALAVFLALLGAAAPAAAKKPPAKRRPPRPHVVQLATAADEALIHHEEETLAAPPPAPEPPRAAEPPVEERPPAHAPTPRSTDVWTGGRYRAFALPRALVDLVGRSNKDLLFHSASVQADFRGERFSFVPALTFADLSTGDVLLGSRGANTASSFSYLKSDMKAVAASAAFLWSFSMSRAVDVELGLEVGLGVTFGPLVDNWVYERADGPLAYGGRRFAPCMTMDDGYGCRPQDHASPTPVRVGNYAESSFLLGGKAPTLLPWVSLPVAGVRARLGRDLAARVGIGVALTGVWAGASLEYLTVRK